MKRKAIAFEKLHILLLLKLSAHPQEGEKWERCNKRLSDWKFPHIQGEWGNDLIEGPLNYIDSQAKKYTTSLSVPSF